MPRHRWDRIDWALALTLAGLAELQLVLFMRCCDAGRVTRAGFLLTLVETVPVAWRRRCPVAVLLLSGAAAATQVLLGSPVTDFGELGILVVFSTMAARSDRRLALTIAALTPAGIMAAGLADRTMQPFQLLWHYAEFAVAWGLGEATRRRRRRLADREARTRREAAETERRRIARELHDVIAHSLSVISIQAGAARTAIDTAPDRLRACLYAIETLSREAWSEMRWFLDAEDPSAPPRTGLAHVADLVERFDDAGLPVDLVVAGEVRPVHADTDLCAYRIVQESLTNTLRHAGRLRARVSIDYGERDLELEIASEGGQPRAGTSPAPAGRHGMSGMGDRVSLVGGELSAELVDGGYVVRARLPIQAAST
jgi:signal transduction histidine kinase